MRIPVERKDKMKIPYRVPTMQEIRSIPWNGLTCVSTFSGCGGSSTGYRMAGFRVLFASEFIDSARECYKANSEPHTFVDGRDIRYVTADDILKTIGLQSGELDIFDGSPPCSAFSTAGKREAGWGTVKKYSDKAQRVDDLFFEFSRLLRGIRPKTFVAENVSGLVKGTAKGYFLQILRELKSCGYKVSCKVIDAQWLGVPQARARTIFIGVRDDLGFDPIHPKPLQYRYSLREAFEQPMKAVEPETSIEGYCTGIEWDRISPGEDSKKYFSLKRSHFDRPSKTICASHGSRGIASVTHPSEKRKFSIAELKRICGFPDDFNLIGTYEQKYERLGRAVPPVMMCEIAKTIRDKILLKIKR
jgi:DNA (cytosine-5)-methyltransferase 1